MKRWSEIKDKHIQAVGQVRLEELGDRMMEEAGVSLPTRTPSAAALAVTEQPDLTIGRGALIRLLSAYGRRATGTSIIEVQKLTYFLQSAGEPLRLNFTKHRFGPHADNLRHVLNRIEGHFVVGFGDGSPPVQESPPLRVLDGTETAADEMLAPHPETVRRIDRVLRLADGFESSYGMELLASVHWVCTHEGTDRESAIAHIHNWTSHKSALFERDHIEAAWSRLDDHGWLPSKPDNDPALAD